MPPVVLLGVSGPIMGHGSRRVSVWLKYYIHMEYIQQNIPAVMLIQHEQHTPLNRQSRRRACFSNIQRPLASDYGETKVPGSTDPARGQTF